MEAGKNSSNGTCLPASIAGATILVPCHVVSYNCNSFEDRAPVDEIYGCSIFKWVCSDLTWKSTRMAVLVMATRVTDMPYYLTYMAVTWNNMRIHIQTKTIAPTEVISAIA